MPIYAYKCSACGHAEDVLQKISDAPLTACPACGQATYGKQVTAAGFQLKGSGWYVTDFRNNTSGSSNGGASSSSSSGGDKASSASTPASTPAPAAASSAT